MFSNDSEKPVSNSHVSFARVEFSIFSPCKCAASRADFIPDSIFSAASEDCDDRMRTCSATTANPRPYSPARAASIAALSANKLVCEAIFFTSSVSSLRFSTSRITPWIASVSAICCSLCVLIITFILDKRSAALVNSSALFSLQLRAFFCPNSTLSILSCMLLSISYSAFISSIEASSVIALIPSICPFNMAT